MMIAARFENKVPNEGQPDSQWPELEQPFSHARPRYQLQNCHSHHPFS